MEELTTAIEEAQVLVELPQDKRIPNHMVASDLVQYCYTIRVDYYNTYLV